MIFCLRSLVREDKLLDKYSTEAVEEQMRRLEFESKSLVVANRNTPYIIRVDGHKFSTFTKHFQKPFNIRSNYIFFCNPQNAVHQAMLRTAANLVSQFNCSSVYVASDEFSLVFAPSTEKETPMFGGRVAKIISLIPSFCAARFNWHLASQVDPQKTPPEA
jgi:tRNA(His) guanylyltransferase